MTENKLYIIIPVHNRMHFTRDCLISLQNQTVRDFRIIVIDDGSTDGTRTMIEKQFPQVVLLFGDGDLWWTAATNRGIEWALSNHATHILTLNNDTLTSIDFIEKMMFWSIRKPDAIIGAFALDVKTKNPVYGGEIINWKTGGYSSLLNSTKPADQNGLKLVTHFPGRGLLIPVEVFHKIGLFDEKHFPHYAADYDFTHHSMRAGFQVFCNYDAHLYIYPDASGSAQITKKKDLKNYFNHLFDIKGGGNLRIFSLYSIRNCPNKYLPWFLLRGYIQRIFGYWYHWLKDRVFF